MRNLRLAQADLFAPPASGDAGGDGEVALWIADPEHAGDIRARLERQLEELRATAAWPFHTITLAAQTEMRFHDLAERWLSPCEGHALQLAFEVEMARLGEAVDYPIYDWKGRYRPVPQP